MSSVLLTILYALSHFLEVNVAARAKAEAVAETALRDHLTGLPNRALLEERLSQMVERTEQERPFALAFIDLDHFKAVNDTLGHQAGDQLLKAVAVRLKAQLSEGDTLARISGDEFAVLLPGVDSAEAVSAAARKLLRALEVPFELGGHLGGHTRQIGASIGVALYPQHSASADDLLAKADRAMYAVKERGKNGFYLFAQTLEDENDAAALERALYEALALEQFELHYQPIFDLEGRISAVEALVRWRHPERGLLSPAAFIEVAEAGDIIVDLGKWVLRSACAQVCA